MRSSVEHFCQQILEITASNSDVLMKFPMSLNKPASGLPLNKIGDAFKDVRLPKAVREKSTNQNPFEQNINQLHEIQKIERKRKSSSCRCCKSLVLSGF